MNEREQIDADVDATIDPLRHEVKAMAHKLADQEAAARQALIDRLNVEARHVEASNSYGRDVLAPLLRSAVEEIEALTSSPEGPRDESTDPTPPAEVYEEAIEEDVAREEPQGALLNPAHQVYFRAGLIACREYMARFIEAQDPVLARSIRANWWPQLGPDLGAPRQLEFAELTEGEYGAEGFRCKTVGEISPTLEALPLALGFLQSDRLAQPTCEAQSEQPAPSGWRERIAVLYPWAYDAHARYRFCFFCLVPLGDAHKPDCLWQNAKDALPSAPGKREE